MRNIFSFFLPILILTNFASAQSYKILESNSDRIKIEVDFRGVYQVKDTTINSRVYQMIKGGASAVRMPGEPWLPEYSFNLAIPLNSEPTLKITGSEKSSLSNKLILPFPEEDPEINGIKPDNFDKVIYSSNKLFPLSAAEKGTYFVKRYSRIMPVNVSPYQYNPVTHELIANKKVTLVVEYNAKPSDRLQISDKMTDDYLKSSVINYQQAVQWAGKNPEKVVYGGAGYGNYWYDPNKNYFKIFLKNKGVYRITFDQLVNSGVPIQGGVSSDALELVNEGNSVPIDVVDGGDGVFQSGDYFQFVGTPPSPTPYCNLNIYNNSNIYWFSYQSDTLSQRYTQSSGFPQNWNRTFNTDYYTIHYEKDSLYETLGYAGNDLRDFWFWGKATAQGGQSTGGFEVYFPNFQNWISDSAHVKLRVGLQGMTLSGQCENNHDAEIQLTNQIIGHALWGDQKSIVYEKNLYVSDDSVHIFPTGNRFTVYVRGNTCETSDEIRINWYEFQYWRASRTAGNHYEFTSPPNVTGRNRYWMTQWTDDNMKVYIPSKGQLLVSPELRNDQYHSALFMDDVNQSTDYYCVSSSYFLNVDSIRHDSPSDLRNPSNGADYIIITHPDFMDAAQRLKTLRESRYPDSGITSPRIKIVDVNQIYDEFSDGLLNPQALRSFVKYAFENWQSPAPAYLVLFGDMSHDYRHLLTTSRPNFIPSIPYYVNTYGRAPSDNLMVDVAGGEGDLAPDLAIGRMSCETPEEADILMDKLENYPQDPGKEWKQDVMLAASGLSLEDELHFHFNQYSNRLADNFLIPNGIHPSRVYNFPSNHEDSMYIGGGPRIRQEIDDGVIIGNYYGHGGGYQWDLIFTNDDIALLENDGRLPVILSVTCYTAHFDDQDVFGEQFNKVPGRGSIGFFGNTVLTYWPIGAVIDEAIFKQIFNYKNYGIGKALFNAKNDVGSGGFYGQQITLLTYLGDPGLTLALPDKPDFVIKPSDITLSDQNPLVNDTTHIKAIIRNLGISFPMDTVNVQVFAESPDTSYLVSTVRLPNFGEIDSILVDWVPLEAALYNVRVEVNELDPIPEMDHSDNIASNSFVVYNISEANVLQPLDGYNTSNTSVLFKFVDIGHYLDLNLSYYIEIDTNKSFASPILTADAVTPSDGILEWSSPQLSPGSYFWRVRIFDGSIYGAWSRVRLFTILNNPEPGFLAVNNGLLSFSTYNVNYVDSSKSLVLNTSELPPKPDAERLLDSLIITDPIVDSTHLTDLTTDGTYLYTGSSWYFALSLNPDGKSKIYKWGSGFNGTVKGQFYGTVPNFFDRIQNSIFYYDNYLYVTTSDPYKLIKVDPVTGDTLRITIPNGLLDYQHAAPVSGSFYAKSNGQYVYNLTLRDTLGTARYVLRIMDPSNNWQLVRPDMELQSTSFPGFTDFFIAKGYIYPAEYIYGNKMRRIRISDGLFEEEWIVHKPFQSHFSWCYDTIHDRVFSGVYRRTGFPPRFYMFKGTYSDAQGTLASTDIGPASSWRNLNYTLDQNLTGSSSNVLYGLNVTTKEYDTLAVNIPENYSLQNISALNYRFLKLFFRMTDTTFNTTNPLEFKRLNVDYSGLPEIMITKKDLYVSPDSVLQGLNTTMHFTVKNIGYVPADSVTINFKYNDSDSTFLTRAVNLDPDSSAKIEHTFSTTPFIFDNSIRAVATYPKAEYFTFNNVISHNFFVVRDSTNPVFNITFDGKEIINGDLVSAKPQVVITLKDNSPLPLDTSYFTLIHTSDGTANILHFSDPDLEYNYTPYPNSESRIIWHPSLKQGDHILEILAKDASGNFFDSTSYRVSFEVVTEYDLRDVYNYPNPFTDGTWFTFKVTGDKLPDELYLRIYTVAGRLIRTINIPSSALGQDIGFKKVFWDGKDEDGDDIANGVYFYKMIYKVKDVVKSVTKKLAKIK